MVDRGLGLELSVLGCQVDSAQIRRTRHFLGFRV